MNPFADEFKNFIFLLQLQKKDEPYLSSDSRKSIHLKGLFNFCTVLKQIKEHLMNLMKIQTVKAFLLDK